MRLTINIRNHILYQEVEKVFGQKRKDILDKMSKEASRIVEKKIQRSL